MTEIKIGDLSVGDWLQDKNGKYAQILGIENWSDGYVLNVRINGVDIGCVPLLAAHPIPLTPKILEKNGFEELKDKSWVGHNHHCHIQQHGSSWTLLANKRGFYRTIRFESLVFVHELQHALRLAGVEKEIEV